MTALALADVETFRNKIVCADALTLARSLPAGSVDMILTDPPYGTTANGWDKRIDLPEMLRAFRRILKPAGAFVMTCQEPYASHWRLNEIVKWRYDWIWEKPNATGFLAANIMPMRAHELVMVFFDKGGIYNPQKTRHKQMMDKNREHERSGKAAHYRMHTRIKSIDDGTRYPRSVLKFGLDTAVHNSLKEEPTHPTQKPVALFAYLIKTYTHPKMIVFDPFMGSGTTAAAARQTGRDFIGGDLSQEYVDLANRRLSQTDPYQHRETAEGVQLSLFAGQVV